MASAAAPDMNINGWSERDDETLQPPSTGRTVTTLSRVEAAPGATTHAIKHTPAFRPELGAE